MTRLPSAERPRERLMAHGACALADRELLAVADLGQVMPPKSTWFEPKLASGLFLHPLS